MSEWVLCSEQTPPEGVPIWIYQPGMSPWIGAYEYLDEDPGGWFYGHSYSAPYFDVKKMKWELQDNEWDDDYQPTHWMPLPSPPAQRGEGQEGGGA